MRSDLALLAVVAASDFSASSAASLVSVFRQTDASAVVFVEPFPQEGYGISSSEPGLYDARPDASASVPSIQVAASAVQQSNVSDSGATGFMYLSGSLTPPDTTDALGNADAYLVARYAITTPETWYFGFDASGDGIASFGIRFLRNGTLLLEANTSLFPGLSAQFFRALPPDVYELQISVVRRVDDSNPPGDGRLDFTVAPTSLPVCEADVNGDRVVDFFDLNIVLADYGRSGPNLQGDATWDGVCDFFDLNIVLAAYGTVCEKS